MELEKITLSEISQTQKIQGHMFSLTCERWRGKKEAGGMYVRARPVESPRKTEGTPAERQLAWKGGGGQGEAGK